MRLIVGLLVALVTYVYAGDYMVGKGVGDITGPSVQINFMGYALPGQRGTGIHLRTFARAFVVSDGDKKVAIVNMDCGMGSDLIKHQVIDALTAKFPDGRYGQNNVLLTGTHTHSAPGGFQQYVLYQITSLGWVEETTSAQVAGIVAAIIEADGNMEAADISVVSDKLFEANINRSPTSYLLNPADERARFADDGDTDKDMTLVRFDRKSGAGGRHKGMQRGAQGASGPLGMMNFFAVHGTSMNNTNTLVSGDNKGFAAYTVERAHNGDDVLPGNGDFVAAFVSTNLGDVSPNTKGPHCIDTGEPCDAYHSTCDGKCENCIASGPGRDMTESTAIIGQKQADMASSLFERAGDRSQTAASSTGTVDFRHSFVKMKGRNVTYTDVESGELKWSYLCTPAMGYAFAAGTTDGPGMFNFEQGTTTGNVFWDHVRDFLSEPTPEEEKCQAPKPILLNTGDVEEPHAWDPATVPVQIVRVGGLFILAAPCELTTMAGRRVRDAVRPYLQQLVDREAQALGAEEGETVAVVIAGLANAYSSYVTTFEEYQAQRYEAARYTCALFPASCSMFSFPPPHPSTVRSTQRPPLCVCMCVCVYVLSH
jgi:neutral ceramidase